MYKLITYMCYIDTYVYIYVYINIFISFKSISKEKTLNIEKNFWITWIGFPLVSVAWETAEIKWMGMKES